MCCYALFADIMNFNEREVVFDHMKWDRDMNTLPKVCHHYLLISHRNWLESVGLVFHCFVFTQDCPHGIVKVFDSIALALGDTHELFGDYNIGTIASPNSSTHVSACDKWNVMSDPYLAIVLGNWFGVAYDGHLPITSMYPYLLLAKEDCDIIVLAGTSSSPCVHDYMRRHCRNIRPPSTKCLKMRYNLSIPFKSLDSKYMKAHSKTMSLMKGQVLRITEYTWFRATKTNSLGTPMILTDPLRDPFVNRVVCQRTIHRYNAKSSEESASTMDSRMYEELIRVATPLEMVFLRTDNICSVGTVRKMVAKLSLPEIVGLEGIGYVLFTSMCR